MTSKARGDKDNGGNSNRQKDVHVHAQRLHSVMIPAADRTILIKRYAFAVSL